MSVDEIIKYNVVYNVTGIDSSIRQSQRLLYFMNAVRLSVTDLQQVMSGATIANLMWTAVQLTRVWTTAYRWVKMTNQAQRVGIAQGALGPSISKRMSMALGIGGFGTLEGNAMRSLFGETPLPLSLWTSTMAFAVANPLIVAGLVGGVVIFGAVMWDRNERLKHNENIRRNREVAKAQGLEW